MEYLSQHIESLIFTTSHPITIAEIKSCLEETFETTFEEADLLESINQVTERYQADEFAFEIIKIGGGYQFLTKGAYHASVGAYLRQSTKKRLSKAAVETLSIIAYKQPVTKSEMEKIRGVSCDYAVQKLLEKDLVAIAGRSDGPGRPLLYATSEKFMDYFGINSLADLPKPKDFKDPDNSIGESAPIEEELPNGNGNQDSATDDTTNPDETNPIDTENTTTDTETPTDEVKITTEDDKDTPQESENTTNSDIENIADAPLIEKTEETDEQKAPAEELKNDIETKITEEKNIEVKEDITIEEEVIETPADKAPEIEATPEQDTETEVQEPVADEEEDMEETVDEFDKLKKLSEELEDPNLMTNEADKTNIEYIPDVVDMPTKDIPETPTDKIDDQIENLIPNADVDSEEE